MATTINSRFVAYEVLTEIYFSTAYSNLALNQKLSSKIPIREQNFIRQLVYGVLEKDIYLNYVIQRLSNTPIKKISSEILVLLKLGLYQIKFLDRVPVSAAVDETVQLAKKIKGQRLSGFVNALLRNFIRKMSELDDLSKLDTNQQLSIKYSCPSWIIEYWSKYFSEEDVLAMLKSRNILSSEISIRGNIIKNNIEDLIDLLEKDGMSIRRSSLLSHYLFVSYKGLLTNHSGFKNGFFSIQDLSSGLAVEAMEVKKNQIILDLCSAPGGKTCAISEKMNNTGNVVACDIYPHRLQLIEANAKRLNLENIRVTNNNALERNKEFVAIFDAVLLDAPCTGFGTFRSKPEIFYHQSMDDVTTLAGVQKKMLNHAADYVKVGGILVYSTCTISFLENQENVRLFLEDHPNFEPEPFLCYSDGFVQILPNEHFQQGFFIAKFRKKADDLIS